MTKWQESKHILIFKWKHATTAVLPVLEINLINASFVTILISFTIIFVGRLVQLGVLKSMIIVKIVIILVHSVMESMMMNVQLADLAFISLALNVWQNVQMDSTKMKSWNNAVCAIQNAQLVLEQQLKNVTLAIMTLVLLFLVLNALNHNVLMECISIGWN